MKCKSISLLCTHLRDYQQSEEPRSVHPVLVDFVEKNMDDQLVDPGILLKWYEPIFHHLALHKHFSHFCHQKRKVIDSLHLVYHLIFHKLKYKSIFLKILILSYISVILHSKWIKQFFIYLPCSPVTKEATDTNFWS